MIHRGTLATAIICVAIIPLAFSHCAKKETGGKVLARYDGGTITQDDLDREIEKYPPQVQARYQSPSGRKNLLDRVLQRRIMVKAATDKGLDKDPAYLQRIEDMKERLLTDALRRQISGDETPPTEDEIREYYNEHEKQYHQPERVRVRVVMVETESEAEKVLNEAKKGTPFVELVEKYSQDEATKNRKGDTGFIAPGSRDSAFEEAAFSLTKENPLSDVVKTDKGFYVMEFVSHRPEVIRTLEQVKDEIGRRIKFERQRKAFDDFIMAEKEKANVVIVEEAFQEPAK